MMTAVYRFAYCTLGLLTMLAVCTGCEAPPRAIEDIVTVYRFENVRTIEDVPSVGTLDEWKYILEAMGKGKLKSLPGDDDDPHRALKAVRKLVQRDCDVVGEFRARRTDVHHDKIAYAYKDIRRLDKTLVRDYVAVAQVESLRDLEIIHGALHALSQKTIGNERVEFKIIEGECQLGYLSNYVLPDIEIVLRGRTDPRAETHLFTQEGKEEVFKGDSWKITIRLVPGHNYVYGYSKITTPRGERIPKHFRINVFTQREETLDKKEFWVLKDSEP